MRDFFNECDNAPRLNEMAEFFSATAAGRSGVPIKVPSVDARLFQNDVALKTFNNVHRQIWGFFDRHFFSSIPYRLEEEIRLGDAFLRYGHIAGDDECPARFYILGAAEGTLARTLAQLGNGKIQTLSCSPNRENEESFFRHGPPEHARFFLGPFHHLTWSRIVAMPALRQFSAGFDLILEDTTFQMYSPNRTEQIGFVKRRLKDDGIFVFFEKFRQKSQEEYLRREMQKDYGYKARFFSFSEIKKKNETILKRMNLNETTLDEMSMSLSAYFKYGCLTWSCGNFCTLAASNSAENLRRLISAMAPPCIPNEYVYEEAPASLPGLAFEPPPFRRLGTIE
ncbi:MAG: class I SAM-dependent methyltransferase [Mesorhizobium sp.]|uniref:class I SAM-dependent methyltransferase n=1 Tax=Mesorhizobium sp. TaxID=1871066 RepID=UPI000FE6A36D|nr:class I SAM-dependent methyltransferase [Mesorhizobium sp.]RWH21131.1 MAG: class I SAM-dependent methyltransferase [Mesorhizobium sp.]RWH38667.1 MAG: class I SAM-dependent methyltransferase [Mesorhizobium sp.]TIM70879.1 MAG: class I SAM-dependent methyltransferase [Mesorhizobium sp.]TIO05250.1 MAG: class I SAM-dependent methyltransferase [Mesorhizobium sp.]TIR61906.1 MAG: class I SAM-dependent methyltransferase [Mesorhizobium sp.]